MIRKYKHAGFQYYKCPRCGAMFAVAMDDEPPECLCEWPSMSGPMVGTELKRLIAEWGFEPCASCVAFAAMMDRRGLQWCEDNRPRIIERLRQQAKKRIWILPPGTDWTLNKMLDTAISRAKQNAQTT